MLCDCCQFECDEMQVTEFSFNGDMLCEDCKEYAEYLVNKLRKND